MKKEELVTLQKNDIIEAYNKSSDENKKFLELLFPSINFKSKSCFDLRNWVDVCEFKNIDPVLSLPYKNPTDEREVMLNALFKLDIIIEILNEGWTPNWDNTNEKKFYPWFYMDNKGGGFRFNGEDNGWAYANSNVGSRFCFKNKELVEHAAKYFIDIYKEFYQPYLH